jgi:hypothetical protein
MDLPTTTNNHRHVAKYGWGGAVGWRSVNSPVIRRYAVLLYFSFQLIFSNYLYKKIKIILPHYNRPPPRTAAGITNNVLVF